MLGGHAMKHWSSTQASIALSSGEAEFAGVLRGAGQGLGFQSLLRDLGVEVPLRVWTDSSAAIGICSRQGLGKLRHLDTHTLWIQQAVRTGRVDLRKVLGEENPADLLTKHSLSRQRLEGLVNLFGCKYLGGRAASAPQVRKGQTSRVTMASADTVLNEVDGQEETTFPRMPHMELTCEELDRLYPSLQAPNDDGLTDPNDDSQDIVYQEGLKMANEIQVQVDAEGRKRRPTSSSSTPSYSTLLNFGDHNFTCAGHTRAIAPSSASRGSAILALGNFGSATKVSSSTSSSTTTPAGYNRVRGDHGDGRHSHSTFVPRRSAKIMYPNHALHHDRLPVHRHALWLRLPLRLRHPLQQLRDSDRFLSAFASTTSDPLEGLKWRQQMGTECEESTTHSVRASCNCGRFARI